MSTSTGPNRRPTAALVTLLAVVLTLGAVVACSSDDDGPGEAEPSGTSSTPRASGSDTTTPSTTTTTAPTAEVPEGHLSARPGPAGGEACGTDDALAAIRSWPLRRRLGQLLMLGVDPSGPAEVTATVTEHHVGSVFVGGNDTTLLASGTLGALREAEPLGLWVAVDEEGGRVQRIDRLAGSIPSARTQAAQMDAAGIRDMARARGEQLTRYGVDVDLAPVVDLDGGPANTVVGDRSYSADPDQAAELAGAFADGLTDAGVLPAIKHFPGHGRASGDSHEGVVTTPPLAALEASDLLPFRALLTPDRWTMAMVGHLDVPDLTGGLPASLSAAAIDLLRDDVGFRGVVITDDLSSMVAVTSRYTPTEAAVAALAAGVDVALLGDADPAALLDALEAAVADGTLVEDAVDAKVARIMRARGVDPCAVRDGPAQAGEAAARG